MGRTWLRLISIWISASPHNISHTGLCTNLRPWRRGWTALWAVWINVHLLFLKDFSSTIKIALKIWVPEPFPNPSFYNRLYLCQLKYCVHAHMYVVSLKSISHSLWKMGCCINPVYYYSLMTDAVAPCSESSLSSVLLSTAVHAYRVKTYITGVLDTTTTPQINNTAK